MLEIGSVIDGKYKILNKVGQGGMSVVYLAMNEKANKQWAVKEVRKDGVKDFEVVRQGLVAETDILKKLSHPNLPSIIDVIDTDDSFIIIMDYIEGNSLNKALDEYGAQPQEMVIEWAKQLCDVLGYLHTRTPPIIYRDMKPANVMLKPDGNVTLIDFGTAREFKEKNLADTTCLGTVGYAAPEQFGGMGQTDARTDIYCLGATLYHLVTGMNPCEPPYEIRPIRQINPALSSGLERIILKCTQRDPNDRYQSAAELMYALEHYEEIDDVHRKKQWKKLAGFIACAVLTVAFAGVSVWGYTSAENTLKQDYDNQLLTASSVEDYYEAILTDPTRTEAYIGDDGKGVKGLVDFLLEDGVLSYRSNSDKKEDGEEKEGKESEADESEADITGSDKTKDDKTNDNKTEIPETEAGQLRKLMIGLEETDKKDNSTQIKVLEKLKEANRSGYEEVCTEIGEAFLFYLDTDDEEAKYGNASWWFQEVKDSNEMAKAYCDINACLQEISSNNKVGQLSKLEVDFNTLWDHMTELLNNAEEYDDDLRVCVWKENVSLISKHPGELCQAKQKNEILSMLNTISQRSETITNTFLQDSIRQLQDNVAEVQKMVESYK